MRRSSSGWKVRDAFLQAENARQGWSSREFQRVNDECADKIYDIREQSDLSRESLLNSDGVASRFYQMEADAVSLSFSPLRAIHPSFVLAVEESLWIEQHETQIRRHQTNACSSLQVESEGNITTKLPI